MIIIPFKEYHAARISDPAQYDSIVTKDLGDGIQLLLGVKKENGEEKTFTQSYHFEKEQWKPKDVKKWLKDHNEKPIELEIAEKETEVKENKSGWDGSAAKQSLFSYASDKDDNINKAKIEKFFLVVEGDGSIQSQYKYPIGKVVNDKPEYDMEGLKSAFAAAMGSHTGTSHPELAKKAAEIAKNEFKEDLTSGMKEELNMKENAIVTHKGDVIQEQVPIDRAPDKLYGNIREQDIPEIAKTIPAAPLPYEDYPDDEMLSEKPEPEGVSEDYDEGEGSQELTEMEDEFELEDNQSQESWDPEQSKTNMMDWAKGEDGKISKRSLMKWYLDVDAGDGQDPNSYRYPVGAVVNGEPHYCHKALDHSWNLASGNQTGIANRNIQKKIIFLKNREDMPLTEDQMDFTERHMSAEKELPDNFMEHEGMPGGFNLVPQTDLKLNSSPAGSKIIYEDDQVIDVPVVPMREGVFTGTDGIPTLKKFEYFGKDAHWLEGQPILKGHTAPTELVTYKHNRIGKLMNVIARPDKKDVVAVARYYKEKLTPEDLTRIKSGTPYDGSIAYTTHTSMTPGELNGTKYNAVEDGGYHFYHFAELANGVGACSTKDGCGFMLNEQGYEPKVFYNDKRRADITKEDSNFSVKLNSSRIGTNPTVTTIYNHISNENTAIDLAKTYVKSGKILINTKPNNDDGINFNKQNSTNNLGNGNSMTKEEFIQADDTEVVDVQKMNEAFEQKLNERDAKIADLTEQVDDLIQKQNAAEQALIDAKAQADFEAFSLKLNAKAREEAKTHYEGFKSDGWSYFDTNPGLLRAETPKMNARGQPAAEGDNGSNLQAARDMLKKNQKELFGKRSH